MLLKGKKIIVTGGASGIGAACVKKFAEQGAEFILIVDMNLDMANGVAEEITKTYGTKCAAVKANIVNEDEITQVYTEYLRKYHNMYPNAGYASGFDDWAYSETTERNFSYGNGSCMRVGGIAVLFDDVDDVIKHAYYSALPSHSHAEGIKGAVCTAVIYWMLAHGATKADVAAYMQKQYPADNGRDINSSTTMDRLVEMNRVNPWSTLSVICQTSLVEAVINFLESDSFESCLRNGYRYLCDRDTISAIAAPMAAIYYRDISVGGIDGKEIVARYFDNRLWEDING